MKLFVDTDLNFPSDDFEALMLLLADERVDIVGCAAAAGNTWAEEVFANIVDAAEVLQLEDLEIFRGASAENFAVDRDLALRAGRSGVRSFLGAHGKAPAPRSWVIGDRCDAGAEHAVDALIRLSECHDGDLVVVSLGPLSNLATALGREPDLVARLRRVIVMGGHFSSPDESTQSVDFNFWFDPQAAQTVMDSGAEILLVPLDVCRKACVNESLVGRCARFAEGRARLFVDDFLGEIRQHGSALALTDQLTALICLAPDLVVSEERGRISIDCSPADTRGRSILLSDPRGTVRVVREVNVVGAHDFMVNLVKRMATQRCKSCNLFGTPAYRYFLGLRLADDPLTVLDVGYERHYTVERTHEIRTVSELAETIVPLAHILIRAKRRGELWPPAPRVDAAIGDAHEGEEVIADQLAWRELEQILFERFLAVRAIAIISPHGGVPRGFSCISELPPTRRRFLEYQFSVDLPDHAILAEFRYVERRSSGFWISEFLGSSLFLWYVVSRRSSDPIAIFAVVLTSQTASRLDLKSSGFEEIAEHVIPDGPEQGRVLILHRLVLDKSTLSRLIERCEVLGRIDAITRR